MAQAAVQRNARDSLWYTEDQYRYAAGCSALEYATSRGYPLVRKGSYYVMRDHDSFVFTSNGHWFWNSRSLNGGAIKFIMLLEDKTLVEAVQILNHVEGQTQDDVIAGRKVYSTPTAQKISYIPRAPKAIEKAPFVLPAQSQDFRRMFGYLCGTRKLDREILQELIHQGNLYESAYRYVNKSTGELKEIHNAVFIGRDAHGEPKSAFQRGLASMGENTTYKRDVPGSDPSAAFCLPGREGVETVIVFEASIDAISHACIYKDAGLNYKDYDRIALGGTEKTVGLTTYLQTHPQISRVVIAMDEDAAGKTADRSIRSLLPEGQYEIISQRQSMGKDWNDYLLRWRQVAEECSSYLTTTLYGMPCEKEAARIHYLDDHGHVKATMAFANEQEYHRQVRLALNGGQRIVAETPAQQERIRKAKEQHFPAHMKEKKGPQIEEPEL